MQFSQAELQELMEERQNLRSPDARPSQYSVVRPCLDKNLRHA